MARSSIDEVAPDIFRIANFAPDGRLLFAQFLIRDDQPLLFHTGAKSIYDSTLNAVSRLIDPKRLRYVSWSHVEGDECGALNNFLAEVPQLEPVQCAIGARYGADFFDRPVSRLIGPKRLRSVSWSHVEGDECGALNNFLAEVPQLEPVQCAIGARYGADFFDRPVSRLIGPKRLRSVSWSHVEGDECGALNNFLAEVPQLEPVQCAIGARYGADFFDRPVSRLIGPKRLRYVSWSHLEGDEGGALNNFLAEVPQLEPVQCAIGARYGADFFNRPVSVIDDDYVLDLGVRKLRFMATPHVPHSWDAICAYEETTRSEERRVGKE